MKRNSKLSLALHTLTHMAGDPDRMRTSVEIAEHAGTNPVVVRRVLGRLRETGLLTSETGHSGGWRLAKRPQDITLADVYLALDENLVSTGDVGERSPCAIEDSLQRRVSNILEEIEESLVKRLGETSLSELHDH